QKTFRSRQCDDSVFRNRTRPCLQYQIKRCTAPCVEFISPEDYQKDLPHARLFLTGNSDELLSELADQMDAASQQLQFEKAANYRDQITALRTVQSQQVIEEGNGDIDVIAAEMRASAICVHILFIRQGRILGSRSFYPHATLAETPAQLLAEFIPQFYLANTARDIPRELIVSEALEEADLLRSALQQAAGRQVAINHQVRSHRAQWLQMAVTAAQQNIIAHINSKKNSLDRFVALQEALGLEDTDRKSTRLNSSHVKISYAVFCLKKKKEKNNIHRVT